MICGSWGFVWDSVIGVVGFCLPAHFTLLCSGRGWAWHDMEWSDFLVEIGRDSCNAGTFRKFGLDLIV